MKRRVFLNDIPNVNLYASEGGNNTGNCADGCTGCTGNNPPPPPGPSYLSSVGSYVGEVITNSDGSTATQNDPLYPLPDANMH